MMSFIDRGYRFLRRFVLVCPMVFVLMGMAFSPIFAIERYNEAPMLTTLVQQGKLPSVRDRLPEEPLVVRPMEKIGKYGGTWNMVTMWTHAFELFGYCVNERLLQWTPDGVKIMPAVAKKWDVSEDGKTYTFYLRKGMKWSDGAPFTADDILFWYQDIILNDELTLTKPSALCPGGKLVRVQKLDDYTVRFMFEVPYGIFLQEVAERGTYFAPKHYLKQFHPSYVSMKTLEGLYKKEGFDAWYKLFQKKADATTNPELPRLEPWVLKSITPTRMVAERNPYYWKVDPSGNQLPYIDRVNMEIVADQQTAVLKAVSGELGFQTGHLITIKDYPLLAENRSKGGYRIIQYPFAGGLTQGLMINQNYTEDPVLGDLLRNRKFRLALSLAINRDEINEIAYYGQGEPRQMVPLPPSPYADEALAKKYIKYDPKEADRLLDEVGLKKRDREGFRLRPDGKPLELTISVVQHLNDVEVGELVAQQLRKVGIKAALRLEEWNLHYTRMAGGLLQCSIWCTDGNEHMPVYPYWTIPYATASRIAPLSGLWYQSGGKSGVEPIGDLKKVIELYETVKVTLSDEKKVQLVKEIFRINVENLWTIGIVNSPYTVIVRNDFRNVPETGVNFGGTLLVDLHPEQYFIEK